MAVSFDFNAIEVGDELPKQEIPITARLIVSGAIASQDFEDVHHDKAAANGKGTPDIFMNILTTNGIIGAYLSRWVGSACTIGRIQLKLGAPNFPGDTMTITGTVKTKEDNKITVDFAGRNGLGSHVSGQAELLRAQGGSL